MRRRKIRTYERHESRASEAITVAWTLSVVMVLATGLMALAARVYVLARPGAERMRALEELALFAACVIGLVSLALLPVVYRVRRRPPPLAIVIFAVIAAAAPLLLVLIQSVQ